MPPPPFFLALVAIWWLVCAIGIGFLIWRTVKWLLGSGRRFRSPVLVVISCFLLTPVPNHDNEYALSAVVWIGSVFLPWQFLSSAMLVLLACLATSLASLSVLWVAGLLKSSGADRGERGETAPQ